MDKLSEYIPALVILAYLVFSLVGKKKKQGKVTQQTTLPGKTAGEYIDEWIFPETSQDLQPKQVEVKPEKKPVRQPEVKITKGEIESFSTTMMPIESEEIGDSLISFDDEEEIKRAIIYTEILRKKEY